MEIYKTVHDKTTEQSIASVKT